MENWEKELDDFMETHKVKADIAPKSEERNRADKFMREMVEPAFNKLIAIFEKHGCKVFVASDDFSRVLEVWSKVTREFKYTLTIDGDRIRSKYKATTKRGGEESNVSLKGNGNTELTMSNITEAHIGNHFVHNYIRTMRNGGLK